MTTVSLYSHVSPKNTIALPEQPKRYPVNTKSARWIVQLAHVHMPRYPQSRSRSWAARCIMRCGRDRALCHRRRANGGMCHLFCFQTGDTARRDICLHASIGRKQPAQDCVVIVKLVVLLLSTWKVQKKGGFMPQTLFSHFRYTGALPQNIL